MAGCASVKGPVSASEPNLYLEKPEVRKKDGVTFTLPEGEYRPAWRDKDGVYYMPPVPILTQFIFGAHPQENVLAFVGNDGRHAIYITGMVRVRYFKDRLPFLQR